MAAPIVQQRAPDRECCQTQRAIGRRWPQLGSREADRKGVKRPLTRQNPAAGTTIATPAT